MLLLLLLLLLLLFETSHDVNWYLKVVSEGTNLVERPLAGDPGRDPQRSLDQARYLILQSLSPFMSLFLYSHESFGR